MPQRAAYSLSFAAAFDRLPLGSAIVTAEGEIVYCNSAFATLLGYAAPADLLFHSIFDLKHPDEARTDRAAASELLDGSRVASGNDERRYRHHDGHFVQCRVAGVPIEVGGRRLIVGTYLDVSSERAQLQAAAESEALHRAVLTRLPGAAILVFDRELRYVAADGEAMFRTVGLSREDIVGRHLLEVASPHNRDRMAAIARQVLAGESVSFTAERNGRVFTQHAVPLHERNGEVTSGLLFVSDVTEALAAQQNVSALIDNSLDWIWSIDRDLRLVVFNETLRKDYPAYFGVDITPGMTLAARQGPSADFWRRHYARALAGERVEFDHTVQANGRDHWRIVSISPIVVGTTITGAAVVARDITERKEAERRLAESRAQLAVLLDNSADAIFAVDGERRLTAFNAVFRDEWERGFGGPPILGETNDDAFPDEMRADRIACYARALAGEAFTVERFAGRPGHERWRSLKFSPVPSPDGIGGVVVAAKDITDLKHRQAMLEAQANEDDVTGLNNRRGFRMLLDHEIAVARRRQRPMVLFAFDLDHLKAINDRFGHKAGDRALREMAEVLRETFRASDPIARLGGDEFAAVAVDTDSPGTMLVRLEDARSRWNAAADRTYPLEWSTGVCVHEPGSALTIDDLLARADRAMYDDKRSRRTMP